MTSSAETNGDAPVLVLADDDEDSRALLAQSARAAGYRIYEVGTGRALVDCVRRLHEQGQCVRAVLSDINMPECDGIDATKQLVQLGSPLRIILMSAFASAPVVREAREAGAERVLLKPFAVSTALDLLARN